MCGESGRPWVGKPRGLCSQLDGKGIKRVQAIKVRRGFFRAGFFFAARLYDPFWPPPLLTPFGPSLLLPPSLVVAHEQTSRRSVNRKARPRPPSLPCYPRISQYRPYPAENTLYTLAEAINYGLTKKHTYLPASLAYISRADFQTDFRRAAFHPALCLRRKADVPARPRAERKRDKGPLDSASHCQLSPVNLSSTSNQHHRSSSVVSFLSLSILWDFVEFSFFSGSSKRNEIHFFISICVQCCKN